MICRKYLPTRTYAVICLLTEGMIRSQYLNYFNHLFSEKVFFGTYLNNNLSEKWIFFTIWSCANMKSIFVNTVSKSDNLCNVVESQTFNLKKLCSQYRALSLDPLLANEENCCMHIFLYPCEWCLAASYKLKKKTW